MAHLTRLENLFNPEVLQRGIDLEYPKLLKFIPLAEVDNTLVGKAGDTITMPAFRYTGDAVVVPEGELIPLDKLASVTRQVTIKKLGKAIAYTDEAMLSGYGDPVGQIIKEHSLAHANKLDNEIIASLNDASLVHYLGAAGEVSSDEVADAMALYGEQEPDMIYWFVSPAQLADLRKNEEWIKATDIGVQGLIAGTRGSIWGAMIVVSNKLAGNSFLVSAGAVRVVMKRGVLVENEREARRASTTVVSTTHYAVYLYDESKVIKLTKEEAPTTYELSFDVDGGRAIGTQIVIDGETGFKPNGSAKVGHTFEGFYADALFADEFDFNEPVAADTIVYVKFEAE